MIYLKRICILMAVISLGACSYFSTGETIEVTSAGLEETAPVPEAYDVGNIIYQKTEGAVEIYDLNKTPQDALEEYPSSDASETLDSNGLVINPSVEVYPIDIPMQKTLKP